MQHLSHNSPSVCSAARLLWEHQWFSNMCKTSKTWLSLDILRAPLHYVRMSIAAGLQQRSRRTYSAERPFICFTCLLIIRMPLICNHQYSVLACAGSPPPRLTGQTVTPIGPASTAKSELPQGTSAADSENIEKQIAALKRQVLTSLTCGFREAKHSPEAILSHMSFIRRDAKLGDEKILC